MSQIGLSVGTRLTIIESHTVAWMDKSFFVCPSIGGEVYGW